MHFYLKVVFGFRQYVALEEVDSAVANVRLMNDGCNAGGALDECGIELFAGSAAGRARVLIVLMAGKSSGEVSGAASSLKTDGIKIIAVGMGGSFDRSQLLAMAFSSSYVLSTTPIIGLPSIAGQVVNTVSEGTCGTVFSENPTFYPKGGGETVINIFNL